MANTVNLEFAGDASKLAAAAKDAERSITRVGDGAEEQARELQNAGNAAGSYADRMGDLGAAVGGATDAIDSMGGGLQAVVDIQDSARATAQKLARANIDVMQAQEDYNQALRDASQAGIDAEQAAVDLTQARLDQKTAMEDYDAAVKEHGKNSNEAKQAMIDMRQAGVDVAQAWEDQEQATRDAAQANIDAKASQVDLNDAMHEANPPELQKWADQIGLITPLLSAAVGVLGLVTAAQWAWNAAQLASPLTWIVLAVAAVVAALVILEMKTGVVSKAWSKAWNWIKESAAAVGRWFRDTLWGKWIRGAWDGILDKGRDVLAWFRDVPGKLRTAFSKVKDFIYQPFRNAFNAISAAWNNTIGALSWTVPGWVPGIGGNSIGVPDLPYFHQGGTVAGPPGKETLAVLQAGEQVRSRSSVAADAAAAGPPIRRDMIVDELIRVIADRIEQRGGRAGQLGIRVV